MTRIIADSTCDYTMEDSKNKDVILLPLKVRFGTKEYLDKITLTNEDFYKKLAAENEMPKTALISTGEFLEAFEKYPEDDIIVITVSYKLSGTYQAALTAKRLSERENIYIVDSGSASLGSALIVDKAVALCNQYPAQKLSEILNAYTKRLRIIGIVDTLKYLVKGGRLSAIQGSLGGILGIKPILLIKNGEIISLARARGMDDAVKKLTETAKRKFKIDKNEEIIFGHANNKSGLQPIIKFMGNPKKSRILTIGSVVGTHTGPGVVSMAFFEHSLVGSKMPVKEE